MSSLLHVFKIETCAAFLQDTSGQDNSQEVKNGKFIFGKSSLRKTETAHVQLTKGQDCMLQLRPQWTVKIYLVASKIGGICLFGC